MNIHWHCLSSSKKIQNALQGQGTLHPGISNKSTTAQNWNTETPGCTLPSSYVHLEFILWCAVVVCAPFSEWILTMLFEHLSIGLIELNCFIMLNVLGFNELWHIKPDVFIIMNFDMRLWDYCQVHVWIIQPWLLRIIVQFFWNEAREFARNLGQKWTNRGILRSWSKRAVTLDECTHWY